MGLEDLEVQIIDVMVKRDPMKRESFWVLKINNFVNIYKDSRCW